MDTKSISDLLETQENNLKKIIEISDRQAKTIESLQAKLEKSQELAKCAGLIENYDAFKAEAKDEGLSLQEWIIQTLHAACQPTADLPIHPEIYRRLKSLADGKGISMKDFGEGDDMSSVLNEALSNYRL